MHTKLLALSLLVSTSVAVRQDLDREHEFWARDPDANLAGLDLNDDSLLIARDAEPQFISISGLVKGAVNGANRPRDILDTDAHYDSELFARDADADPRFNFIGMGRAAASIGRGGGRFSRGRGRGGNAGSDDNNNPQRRDALDETIGLPGLELYARDLDNEDFALLTRDADPRFNFVGIGRAAASGARGARGAARGVNKAADAASNAANAYDVIRNSFGGRDVLDSDMSLPELELYARDVSDDDSSLFARDADPQTDFVSSMNGASAASLTQSSGQQKTSNARMAKVKSPRDFHERFEMYAREAYPRGGGAGFGRAASGAARGLGAANRGVNSLANTGMNVANAYGTVRGVFGRRDADAMEGEKRDEVYVREAEPEVFGSEEGDLDFEY